MLQKKKYITPTTRFASTVQIFDPLVSKYKNFYKNKKKLKKQKKTFYKATNLKLSNSWTLNFAGVVSSYSYNKKPFQAMLNVKSIYNNNLVLPGIEFLVPSKKVFDFTKNIIFKKVSYLGSHILLCDVPYYLHVCFIMNNYNNKLTYAKSSGMFGLKLKAKKTVKLILIKLPSLTTYFFIKTVSCFLGKNTNFFNNKFIEGKWGFSIHNSKTLEVRGVAKNPVDHPNGGRTKAKQPEKSPWGWIAKQKK